MARARPIEDAGREGVKDLMARAVGLGNRETLRVLDAGLGGINIDGAWRCPPGAD